MAQAACRPPFFRTPMQRIGYGAIRVLAAESAPRISLRTVRATMLLPDLISAVAHYLNQRAVARFLHTHREGVRVEAANP
jgi:hypothetical protein